MDNLIKKLLNQKINSYIITVFFMILIFIPKSIYGTPSINDISSIDMAQYLQLINDVAEEVSQLRHEPCWSMKQADAWSMARYGHPVIGTTCQPVYITTTWKISEKVVHNNQPIDILNRTIQETTVGDYIVAKQGYGVTDIVIFSDPSKISSSKNILLDVYSKIWVPTDDGKGWRLIFTSNSPKDFSINANNEEDYGASFRASSDENTVVEGQIFSSYIQLANNPDMRIPFPFAESIMVDNTLFSYNEIVEGAKKGSLERTFNIPTKIDDRTFSGTVHIKLSFKPSGKLLVYPKDNFKAIKNNKGKYVPQVKTYHIKNTGKEKIQFKNFTQATWLSISPSSGSLEPSEIVDVKLSINDQIASLQEQNKEATVQFENITNSQGSSSRKVILSNKEKWKYTIYGENDLFFGDNIVYGGVRVSWRTDVIFEIEDHQYKSGQGKTYFVSIKSISNPPGVFDCITTQNSNYFKHTNYTVSGNVKGKQVTLNIPTNSYNEGFQCLTDTDLLKDYYIDYYTKIKWGTAQQIKDQAESKVHSTRKSPSDHFNMPILSGELKVPLIDGWKQENGKSTSVNYSAMEIKKIK